MKESLKAELEKLKLRNSQLNEQFCSKQYKQNIVKNRILSVVGQSLTPTIHKVGMSFGIKRTKTGSYRVHGKTYRNKKLAEKRWMKDCSMLQNFNGKKKGTLIETVIGGLGDVSGLILPAMYNLLKKKD